MKRKLLSLLLASVMLFSFAACGSTETTTSTATPETTSESTETEGETTDSTGDGGKLVYWSMWNETEPQGQVMSEAIAAYTEKTGIEIEIQWKGRDVNTLAQPAIQAGEQVDIFEGYLFEILNRYVPEGLVIPVDDYLTQTYDTTGGLPYNEAVDTRWLDVISKYSEDGMTYGAPIQGNVQMFFYNMDIFEEAGVTATPTTWEEFLAVCEQIKAAGYIPLTVDDAYYGWLIGNYLSRAVGVEEAERIINEADYDAPAVLEMANAYAHMVELGYISEYATGNKFPAGQQEVALGEVAMYFNGSWLPNELLPTTGPDFNWGGFLFPTVEGGVEPATTTDYGSMVFAITSTCEMPNEAFDFISFMTTGEWDATLAERSAGIPVSNDAQWPGLLSNIKEAFGGITDHKMVVVTNTDSDTTMKSAFGTLLGGGMTGEEYVAAIKG